MRTILFCIYDIKPYVPYADRIEDATSAWAQTEESRIAVNYDVETVAKDLSAEERQRLDEQIGFIRESLSLDPRPAHERGTNAREGQTWGVILGDFEVKFTASGGELVITRVQACSVVP